MTGIVLNGRKQRAFLLKPRIRKGSKFFSLINTEKAVRQEKREKEDANRKGVRQGFWFLEDAVIIS